MLPDLSPVWLSLIVAGTATSIAVPVALFFAYQLSGRGRSLSRSPIRRGLRLATELFLTLPLVLPPTVVGYALLLLLGRGTAIGLFLNDHLHLRLLFTWEGAAIAAAIMALPLIFRTAESAFRGVDSELLEMGRTLGASEGRLFWSVLLPLSYRGVLAGIALGFARALGEFGATLMVAGSIPGRTQTLPLALYNAVLNGQDADARIDTVLLVGVAVVLLGAIHLWGGRISLARGDRNG
jgi:molybdate transport system permease protein